MENILLIYDAPPGTNPHALCRAAGMIHLQGSAWIARPWQLSADTLRRASERLISAGGKWATLAFSTDEAAAIQALAASTLESEIAEIRTSLRDHLTAASLALSDGGPIEKSKSLSYSAIYRAKRALTAAETAATVFDLMQSVSTLLDSLKKTLAAESAAYFATYCQKPQESLAL